MTDAQHTPPPRLALTVEFDQDGTAIIEEHGMSDTKNTLPPALYVEEHISGGQHLAMSSGDDGEGELFDMPSDAPEPVVRELAHRYNTHPALLAACELVEVCIPETADSGTIPVITMRQVVRAAIAAARGE